MKLTILLGLVLLAAICSADEHDAAHGDNTVDHTTHAASDDHDHHEHGHTHEHHDHGHGHHGKGHGAHHHGDHGPDDDHTGHVHGVDCHNDKKDKTPATQ